MDNSKYTLLVLAAGVGSRYGGIKQMDGFGPDGETIMDYSLFDAIRAGFNKIVFIVREEILDAVKEKFLPKLEGKAEVAFVIQSLNSLIPPQYQQAERVKPWGTGHAMLCAKEVINEPFGVINADDFYGSEAFSALMKFFKSNQEAHALVGYTLKYVLSEYGSVSRGCGETDAQGFLSGIVERITVVKEGGKILSKEATGDLELSPETPTSMNFWGFHPSIFNIAKPMFDQFVIDNQNKFKAEFFIPLFVNAMIKQKLAQVKVVDGGSTWFGVTYQEDKPIVKDKIKELARIGKYPAPLWK